MPQLIISVLVLSFAYACTNLIVTKGASAEGYNTFTYAADSTDVFGEVKLQAAARYPPGSKRKIFEWITDNYLGEINETDYTFSTVGNMNEKNVAIGETTFEGREELLESDGILDYGSLIYIALQRASTAREAIRVITSLVEEYGYFSSGETFTISDPNEIWIMEMVSKGRVEQGAVWAAVRLPDGTVSGHANQARIQYIFQFEELLGKENVMYSKDVVDFAVSQGWWDSKKDRMQFDFAATYGGLTREVSRICDFRVLSFLFNVLGSEEGQQGKAILDQFNDYIMGLQDNYTSIRPQLFYYLNNDSYAKKVPLIKMKKLMDLMADHYDAISFTQPFVYKDCGAGPYNCPIRVRPLEWTHQYGSDSNAERMFSHERPISTQQTGWVMLAQCRCFIQDNETKSEQINDDYHPKYPPAILWFGLDDGSMTYFIPLYSIVTSVHKSLTSLHNYTIKDIQDQQQIKLLETNVNKLGEWNILNFSFHSAFWAINMLSNFCYGNRYKTIRESYIDPFRNILHESFLKQVGEVDRTWLTLHHSIDGGRQFNVRYADNSGEGNTVDLVAPSISTSFVNAVCWSWAEVALNEWTNLFKQVFFTFYDGTVRHKPESKSIHQPQHTYDQHSSSNSSNNDFMHYFGFPIVESPGYEQAWLKRIVADAGDRYIVPDDAQDLETPAKQNSKEMIKENQ